MAHPRILDPNTTYTFARYFELPFERDDILAELGCHLSRAPLQLPRYAGTLDRLQDLHFRLAQTYQYTTIGSEQARREFLIAPIVSEVCLLTRQSVRVEYPIVVSQWLRGSLDYYFQAGNLLIIEAKRENLYNGFTQLAAELIALDQWIDSTATLLYGAVTTGEDWRFGIFDRQERAMVEDLKLYRVPEELEDLVRVLIGIVAMAEKSS